jgi:ubiquinone/menaquinone biosynthesis C-methylase UbiE
VPTLSTLEAYERWAATYPPIPHNPLMRAEQRTLLKYWPEVAGLRALDLACGTGRYAKLLSARGAAPIVTLDFSVAMLRQVQTGCRVQADMMRLPFANEAFDIVIAGLALGHSTDIRAVMREIARVLTPGGLVLYSDFHPDAARAGMTRSFKDEHGCSYVVPHCRHEVAAHREATAAENLTLEVMDEVRVGIEFREDFQGSTEFFQKWRGLPLVLVVRARK